MPRHSEDHVCASVGHRHWSFYVVWCAHEQAFTLRRSSHCETGTDADPVDYSTSSLRLGPFDTGDDVAKQLGYWIIAATHEWQTPRPCLPGS